MTTLAIDRSTRVLSAAVSRGGAVVAAAEFPEPEFGSAGWLADVMRFAANADPRPADRFVVGLGPGSFSGIRAALAAVRGLALPGGREVRGLPSPFAYAKDSGRVAVAGDARRGKFWVVVFDGLRVERGFALVEAAGIAHAVPDGCEVASPDGDRIGGALSAAFGARFRAGPPSARRLAEIAETHPEILSADPLPVYLTPAVRPPESPERAQQGACAAICKPGHKTANNGTPT